MLPLSWRQLPMPARCLGARVRVTTIPKPWLRHKPGDFAKPSGSTLVVAEQLFPREVMAEASRLVMATDASGRPVLQLDQDADSVDGAPTYEVAWVRNGCYTNKQLADIFRPSVETRLLPLIRRLPELHGMSDADGRRLVLCEALLRMYREGERRVVPAHYDSDALVTAVVEIDCSSSAAASQPEGGLRASGFNGPGFYVQEGAHVSSRRPVRLAPGDVAAHSYDLQHGVDVRAGQRCSVIFWFSDSAVSCASKARPWYERSAAEGDPDAQYNLGCLLLTASTAARPADSARGLALLRDAAAQGHFVAQNRLAHELLSLGRGAEAEAKAEAEAVELWEASAVAGYHRAMQSLAGHHRAQGWSAEALRWHTLAAEQRADPRVMFSLGELLYRGAEGQEANPAAARRWVREAAEMGQPDAQLLMGELAPDAEVEGWLLKASQNGSVRATVKLGRLYVHGWQGAKLLSLVVTWWRRIRHTSSTQDAASLPQICFHEGSSR